MRSQAATTQIALIFYCMIKKQVEYGGAAKDTQGEQRLQNNLRRQAKQFGYLVPIESTAA